MQHPPPVAPSIPELPLEWIPSSMRTKMDQARVRLSLSQWQVLPLPEREELTRLSAEPATSPADFVQALATFLANAGAGPLRADPGG
ncbi:MAG: nitrate reductase associated protein [Burkholderiaceae bacterium]